MDHNGSERYYMEEPGVDEEAEDHRREYEWNQYANRDSPNRSATDDYPRYEEERRRLEERRDLREELNRDDCSSLYSNGSRSRSIPYRSRSRSPIRMRDRSGDREMRNDDRERSDRSRYRNDDSPPYRRVYDRDDRRSPRERRSSPHSSRSRDSGRDWSRRACPTVAIRYIPSSVVEVDIRDELRASRAHYIDLKMDYEEGPKNSSAAANHRVCYVEFETTRDAVQWMEEHQGSLRIGRDKMPMAYDIPEAREISINRRRDRSEHREDDDSDDDDDRRPKGRLGTPTDTMIVKGMDYNTTEEQIRQSFEYITHFPIQDIRLVKDKYGKSRGFCFVQWRGVEDCTAVIEYLRTAKPRFHILGRHVELDYSSPQGSSRVAVTSRHMGNGNPLVSGAAAAAIQAAHWSRGGNQSSRMPPVVQGPSTVVPSPQQQRPGPPQMNNVPTSSATPNKSHAAPVLVKSSPQASVPYQDGMYPTPDTSKFQYDSTSGYYYDAQTRLYYDANSRYFYNNISGQYLYWEESKKNYVAVSEENQAKQQKASDKKEKDQKESKSKNAKKIAKDMERWAKAQNRKKEEIKKLMEDSPVATTSVTTAAVETKKESATADTVFSLLSKESAETERLKAVHAAYNQDSMFKRPDPSLLSTQRKATISSTKTNGGLVSYMRSSDSEEEEDDDEEYINWTKLACLLCRRAFPSKEVLSKHIEMSDLHKENLLTKRNSKMGSLTEKAKEEDKPSQVKYRDRAAERRSKFGVEKLDLKKSHSSRAPVPYEQPTKDGLDQTNIGNQMLQKMGWKQGSGLGKSQSGITDPITVQQRTRGAGLGMRGASYGLDGSESGDYRKVAKKVTMARFYEGGH